LQHKKGVGQGRTPKEKREEHQFYAIWDSTKSTVDVVTAVIITMKYFEK